MDYLQLFYDGQYDELVKAAFPVLQSDKDAERAFLRLFMSKNATVLLDFDETIEPLIQEANEGKPTHVGKFSTAEGNTLSVYPMRT